MLIAGAGLQSGPPFSPSPSCTKQELRSCSEHLGWSASAATAVWAPVELQACSEQAQLMLQPPSSSHVAEERKKATSLSLQLARSPFRNADSLQTAVTCLKIFADVLGSPGTQGLKRSHCSKAEANSGSWALARTYCVSPDRPVHPQLRPKLALRTCSKCLGTRTRTSTNTTTSTYTEMRCES